MSEKLTLRGTNSPFVGVYQDINKGSVLSHSELDGNFVLLKGHVIYDINVDNQTIIFKKLNGNDLSFDIDVDTTQLTGGTYNSTTGTATFTDNIGGTFDVVGFFKESDDIYTSGFTFNPANYDLTIFRNDGNSFTQNLSILASDMTITGGTYNNDSGVATFTNNTGGTFNVSGFLTGFTDNYWTSGSTGNYSIKAKNDSGLDATGVYSVAEGYNTLSSGDYGSHAEGLYTTASGVYGAHAEGDHTIASGYASHAEGSWTTASGEAAHAEGNGYISKW